MRLVFIVSLITALSVAAIAQVSSYSSFSLGVRSSKQAYELAQPVTLEFAVRNVSSSTTTLNFPTAKQFDLWVTQGDGELYRASKGRMYAQSPTSMTLRPGQTATFTATWNQLDMGTGKQVGPGVYMVYAQLTPSGRNRPPVTTGKLQIGMVSTRAALVPVTVCEAVANAPGNLGRRVMIAGTYRGTAADVNDPNTKPGPPVGANDWVICDATGCLYVNGMVTLDPAKDVGTKMTVVGRLARTNAGQVYLTLVSATTAQGSVCPI